MAITYNLLLEADFTALEAAGESWLNLYQVLEDQAAALVDLKAKDTAPFGIDNWDGQSGEAARERVRDIVLALDERSAAARRVSVAITVAVEEFRGAQTDLNDVIAEIDGERVALTDTGSVIPDTSTGTDNVYYAEGLNSRITAALERATEADEALKVAIGTWAETFSESERLAMITAANDEASELQELIDSGASPEKINDWWNNLSEAERLGILEGNPALVAGLDGIPTDTRDAANRELLDAELDGFTPTLDSDIAAIEEQMAQMEADGTSWVSAGHYSDYSDEYKALQDELAALETERDRRDALTGLQDAITGQASTGQDYYLIDYASAEDGRAIVSVGNPDTADNTAVYVPGTTAELDGFGNEIARAENLAAASNAAAPGQETAAIAWLDYDAPDEVKYDAFSMEYAEQAGPTLSRFTEGLSATHTNGDGHTTLIGHSYGTTVVGHTAAEHGVDADKIIAVASPGLDTVHADELQIGAENVYVTTAENDAILQSTNLWTDVFDGVSSAFGGETTSGTGGGPDADGDEAMAWHGEANPLHDDYGATEFPSESLDPDGNETTDGSEIHGGYFNPSNVALENMAYIITDQPEEIREPEEDGT
jgi:pimeloyl-ACP methyl ester carboxylesterase